MEDRAIAFPRLPNCKRAVSLFGVIDGHGGDFVADFVARRLPELLAKELSYMPAKGKRRFDAVRAIEVSFAKMEDLLAAAAGRSSPGAFDFLGAVVNIVVLIKGRLLCANLGDCRAVLRTKGKAVALSRDHNPDQPDELERLTSAGALVRRGSLDRQTRIDDGLNMSRAFGDFAYKRRQFGFSEQKVIAQPEIKEFAMTDEDEFFTIACDGVTGIFSSEELVEKLAQARKTMSLEEAVEEVLSIAQDSGDNCTLCVVERQAHRGGGQGKQLMGAAQQK